MPSVFSHAVFSSALGAAYARGPMPRRFWVMAALCSVVPDLDVVAFAFGVPYGSMWGHRGITHSLAFAVLLGCAMAAVAKTNRSFASLAVFFTAATASHLALDMLTNGGLGVAALAPFSAERFFAPWRPIEVSPIGVGFFSARGMAVLASEILWV